MFVSCFILLPAQAVASDSHLPVISFCVADAEPKHFTIIIIDQRIRGNVHGAKPSGHEKNARPVQQRDKSICRPFLTARALAIPYYCCTTTPLYSSPTNRKNSPLTLELGKKKIRKKNPNCRLTVGIVSRKVSSAYTCTLVFFKGQADMANRFSRSGTELERRWHELVEAINTGRTITRTQ